MPPGEFSSPLGDPAMTPHARLPIIRRDFTPTPTITPTPTLTPTPSRTPTPIKYGWKGVGHTGDAAALGANNDPGNDFWGINPDWWYDWHHSGITQAIEASSEEIVSQMALRLTDPEYVPIIWCTSDVDNAVPPEEIAGLARDHPGRVWLMFNEPDNDSHSDSCGYRIKIKHDYYTSQDWEGLGRYLADEYGKYATAILNADRTARVFTFAPLQLPMPGLTVPTASVDYGQRAIPLWKGFLTALASTPTPPPIHGIAIHAYPNNGSTFHLGPTRCNGVEPHIPQYHLDPNCVKRAIESAYPYFQGVPGFGNPHPELTKEKPIWLTETGVLIGHSQLSWDSVKTGYQTPLMNWLIPQMAPNTQSCCAWINSVAWYSTHRAITEDLNHTASNLLVPTPMPTVAPGATPVLGTLTPLGEAWKALRCDECNCPGYDCKTPGVGK